LRNVLTNANLRIPGAFTILRLWLTYYVWVAILHRNRLADCRLPSCTFNGHNVRLRRRLPQCLHSELQAPRGDSLLDGSAMRTVVLRTLCIVLFLATRLAARDVIPLQTGAPPGSTPENYPEKEYFSKVWNTEVVANVTKPSLTVFKPSPKLRNGTAVVICPGGGFMALSITSEGTDVAKFMAARGVTAFMLKYRLAHTGDDATQEFVEMFVDKPKFQEMAAKVVPLSIADGLAAVTYVRQHASEWGVSPDRVGIIGFSAGGTVAAGVAFHYRPEGRPAFVAPIYAAGARFKDDPVPADAPPMFAGLRQMIS
jgi:hypothetical protein